MHPRRFLSCLMSKWAKKSKHGLMHFFSIRTKSVRKIASSMTAQTITRIKSGKISKITSGDCSHSSSEAGQELEKLLQLEQ